MGNNTIMSFRLIFTVTSTVVAVVVCGYWASLRMQLTSRQNFRFMEQLAPNEFFLAEQLHDRVKSLHLIGERHSGTRWMFQHLNECFNTSVILSEKLTRWKHWFQYEDENHIDAFTEVYVVAMFRNPYDWVERMRKVPYHSPRHKNMTWNEFVTTPWTMPRYGRDLLMEQANDSVVMSNDNSTHRSSFPIKHAFMQESLVCENDFSFHQVVPCAEESMIDGMHPVYEHEPSTGRPYSSILELRRDKIINFLSVRHYSGVKYFDAWKYEDVIQEGSAQLVRQLEFAMGVEATCQPRYAAEMTKKRRRLSTDYIEWMQEHVDWETSESLIGYRASDYE